MFLQGKLMVLVENQTHLLLFFFLLHFLFFFLLCTPPLQSMECPRLANWKLAPDLLLRLPCAINNAAHPARCGVDWTMFIHELKPENCRTITGLNQMWRRRCRPPRRLCAWAHSGQQNQYRARVLLLLLHHANTTRAQAHHPSERSKLEGSVSRKMVCGMRDRERKVI